MAFGKTTCCDILNKLDVFQNWKHVAFGDGVKECLGKFFALDRETIEKWKRNDEAIPGFKLNVRKSLQKIGDEFREINQDVWINYLLNNQVWSNLLIGDGRYLSEAASVKQKNGINVLLWRPGFENDCDHRSEKELKIYIEKYAKVGQEGKIDDDYFDYFLINDGTIEDLENKLNIFIGDYYNNWKFA